MALNRIRILGREIEYKWFVAAIYVSALFLDVLDVTIVNVALPQLGAQLKSDAVEWVVVGYTLALAVSIPAAGWWSDKIGTKRAFLTSLALFIGASMLCGCVSAVAPPAITLSLYILPGELAAIESVALTFHNPAIAAQSLSIASRIPIDIPSSSQN